MGDMATDYTARLKTVPLFASLKADDLNYINGIVQQVTYLAGQVIFRQGEEGNTFYIIDTGHVSVCRRDESGAEAIVRFLGPGEFFGETALLYHEPRNATIEANLNTTLFFIEKGDFSEMVARLPAVQKRLEAAAGLRRSGLRRFSWQEPDEVAIWVAYRNVVPLILESAGGLLAGLGIAVIMAILSFLQLPRLGDLLPPWALRSGAVLVTSLVLIWHIVDWTNDYLVLTDRRVVHVERYGFIREVRNEIPIQAVQNVVLSRRGMLAAMLGLADITIETIGGTLIFTHIPAAVRLQERILDQRTRVQQEARREEREVMRQELIRVIQPASVTQPTALQPAPPDAQPGTSPRPPAASRPSLRGRLRALRPATRMEKPGEIIWRKHWLLLVKRLVGPAVLLLAIPALAVIWWQLSFRFAQTPSLTAVVILAPFVLIALATVWVWWAYQVWGQDLYILTTDRLVDIERHPLGLRVMRRESPLDRIQDIEVDIRGLWARVFDMGDVRIKTAGGDFTFHAVADPRSVQRDIFHRLAEFRRREQEQQRRQRFEEMVKWLGVYNELTIGKPPEAEVEEKESE